MGYLYFGFRRLAVGGGPTIQRSGRFSYAPGQKRLDESAVDLVRVDALSERDLESGIQARE